MKSKIKILAFVFLLLISAWHNLMAFDFHTYFSKMTLGEDPGEPDTLYMAYLNLGATKQAIKIRLKTDNVNIGDSIIGVYIPLVITTDKPGVILDSSVITTYRRTSMANWNFKFVSIFTLENSYPGDPEVFPMHLLIGGSDSFFDSVEHPLGNGDYLLAKLVFTVSEPTKICVDTTSKMATGLPLLIVTKNAVGYLPQWRGGCYEPTTFLGDINEDYLIDLLDIVCLLDYLFRPSSNCALYSTEVADVNCDGRLLLSDVIVLINLVFRNKPISCF